MWPFTNDLRELPLVIELWYKYIYNSRELPLAIELLYKVNDGQHHDHIYYLSFSKFLSYSF